MENVGRVQKSEKFSDTEADEGKKGAGSFPQEFVRTLRVCSCVQVQDYSLASQFSAFSSNRNWVLIVCNWERK